MSSVSTVDLVAAADLDRFLGDPDEPGARMPTATTLRDDAASAFPADAIEALDEWGAHRYYVPRAYGGELDDVLTPLMLMRTVARRDVTAAVGHGKTVLGAVCAWAAADDTAAHMASIVRAAHPVSWGLTEQGRGSDIAAAHTTADIGADAIVVTGHKWPIGNATRGRAITTLARTDDKPGPRALSLVLVDKYELESGMFGYRPRRALHGIRGADISGIDFTGARIPTPRLIGGRGRGVELVLKSLQLTRTLCAALSLGAADQAVAVMAAAVRTADDREALAAATADLLLAESVAFAGVRSFHTAPEEMALVSACVKYLVPDAVDGIFRDAAAGLGAAALIADGPIGRFEKAARDSRVVGIFDGNSVVNLNVVINEFPNIVRSGDVDADAVIGDFRFPSAVTAFDMSQLRLITRRGSRLLNALPTLAVRAGDDRVHRDAARLAARIVDDWAHTRAAIAETERAAKPPASQFALAERVTLAFAAAAALAVWLANHDQAMTPAWHDDTWLRATLLRIARRLGVADGRESLPVAELAGLAAGGRPVSILPGWVDGGAP